MAVQVAETASDQAAFVDFHEEVHGGRAIRWPNPRAFHLSFLSGDNPFRAQRRIRPLLAIDGGRIVARAVAMIDERYLERWRDGTGHIMWFDAKADAGKHVGELLDAACAWLAGEGASSARMGFVISLDAPFITDDYDALPVPGLRHTHAYYHDLIKAADFGVESSWGVYKLGITDRVAASLEESVRRCTDSGITIAPLDRTCDRTTTWLTDLYNASLAKHFGVAVVTRGEIAFRLAADVAGASLIAREGDTPVGFRLAGAGFGTPITSGGRVVLTDEKTTGVAMLAIEERFRRRGVSEALTARSILEERRRGFSVHSYALVWLQNFASRGVFEKLGGTLRSTYVQYRREGEADRFQR